MDFRSIDYSNDIPEIVALLRTSLSSNHSIENFSWKHYENPFGKSYGLLALDNQKIIGVRMFMFWEFQKANKILRAIRPVDTITHPDYRGKGIFKKLTLRGLEDCRADYDFVFNTPNNNSYPGYIRMGWHRCEQDLSFKIAFTLNLKKRGSIKPFEIEGVDLKNVNLSSQFYRTNFSNQYLHWRYQDDIYMVAKFQENFSELYVIYKKEKIKGIKTLIIEDVIGDFKNHKLAVTALANYLNIFVIYYLESPLLNLNFLISRERSGSIVVFKDDDKKIPESLSFSAGDLDGKL